MVAIITEGRYTLSLILSFLACFQAADVSYEDILGAKQLGFSDKQIAKCIHKWVFEPILRLIPPTKHLVQLFF